MRRRERIAALEEEREQLTSVFRKERRKHLGLPETDYHSPFPEEFIRPVHRRLVVLLEVKEVPQVNLEFNDVLNFPLADFGCQRKIDRKATKVCGV